MKTITIASAKGGSGKSTITAALAVRACQDTKQVAMMDLNFDQGSLTQWWQLAGRTGGAAAGLECREYPARRADARERSMMAFHRHAAGGHGPDRAGHRGC